jgi:hypothetical protein
VPATPRSAWSGPVARSHRPTAQLYDFAVPAGIEPIVHRFSYEEDDLRFEEYYAPKLKPRAPELTAEVEAMLVRRFRPAYNEIKFENYPEITNGTRSAGYTYSSLIIEQLPVLLKTAHHTQDLIGLQRP